MHLVCRTRRREKSIVNILENISSLSKKEVCEGKFTTLTTKLAQMNEYAIYLLIKSFVLKYRKMGILKSYKLSELLTSFKWKKTQLNYNLKQAVKQNVLFYNKRKYSLNLDNILVKRVWNFYFTFTKDIGFTSTNMIEIASMLTKKKKLEKQILLLSKYKEEKTQSQNNIGLKKFVNEVQTIMYDGCDPKDNLILLCWEKLHKVL